MEDDIIHLIDQRHLPGEVRIISAGNIPDQIECIRTLAVRGAPAIGAFGAVSLALSIKREEDPGGSFGSLLGSRPTAVDLRNCMDEVMDAMEKGLDPLEAAMALYHRIIESCRRIGKHGAGIIPDDARILTHCNAGALATMDWGTALSPIRIKKLQGGDPFVWVSETRPLLQGSRLTAWELSQEGISHSIIVDSASGYLMRKGEVDLVITGADRVCANGDIANKIGTFEKAVIARDLGIPFYVAFPVTTIDPRCSNGDGIPIEERDGSEVKMIRGKDISPAGSSAFNPAFDVTPGELVTAYITEEGVFSRNELVQKYIKKAPM